MDLYPSDVRAALARFPIASQERLGDQAKVIVKYFFPAGRYTFYVTEGDKEGSDIRLFGYCVSALGEDCDEWGYTMLSELQNLRVRGLTMERDLHFPIATCTVADALARAA
ncbi:MAG: DUF2958 domain-containing protein [Thermoanaerobaculia bacterium]